MIFRSSLHFHSEYAAWIVVEWNLIWNDPCLNLVVIICLWYASLGILPRCPVFSQVTAGTTGVRPSGELQQCFNKEDKVPRLLSDCTQSTACILTGHIVTHIEWLFPWLCISVVITAMGWFGWLTCSPNIFVTTTTPGYCQWTSSIQRLTCCNTWSYPFRDSNHGGYIEPLSSNGYNIHVLISQCLSTISL